MRPIETFSAVQLLNARVENPGFNICSQKWRSIAQQFGCFNRLKML